MPDINNPNYFKDFDLDSLKVIAHGWVERYPVIKKILLFRGCRSRGTKDYKYKYILLVEHSIIRNPDDPLYPHYKEFLEDWINSNHSYFYQDLADAYSGDSLELNQLIFILPTNLPTINTALPPLDFIITGFPFILYDKEKEDAGDFDKERPGVLDEDKIKPLSPGKKELQESSGLKKDEYLNNPAIVQLAKEADSDTKIIYNAMIEDCRSKEVSFVNGWFY